MTDVLLHILGAAIMMVPAFLSSTPIPAVWFWAVVVSAAWFVREWTQRGTLEGWGVQKIFEAGAPATVAMLLAVSITIWRLSRAKSR